MNDSDASYGELSYRYCSCGWEGEATDDACPECGAEWFVTPEGEVNAFPEPINGAMKTYVIRIHDMPHRPNKEQVNEEIDAFWTYRPEVLEWEYDDGDYLVTVKAEEGFSGAWNGENELPFESYIDTQEAEKNVG